MYKLVFDSMLLKKTWRAQSGAVEMITKPTHQMGKITQGQKIRN